MPAYIRFLHNGVPIRGAVSSGLHMGWTELLSFEMGRHVSHGREFSTSSASEIVVTKATDASSPRLRAFASQIFQVTAAFDPEDLTAEVDFTRAGSRGDETTVLRAFIHGVRIVSHQPIARTGRAGNDIAMEKVVIVHEGITRAGASRSATDITQQVRAQLRMYDFPGAYAQRFDGIDKGGGD